MTTPSDPGAREGDLGSATDEEWLIAHRALVASGAIPPSEAAYLYDPDRDPADVTADDLTPFPDAKEPGDA